MNTIICNVNMFAESPIMITQDSTTKVVGYFSLEEIHKVILAGCYKYNIDNVKFSGNKKFISAIIEDLNLLNDTEFSGKKKINVEVL